MHAFKYMYLRREECPRGLVPYLLLASSRWHLDMKAVDLGKVQPAGFVEPFETDPVLL